MGPNVSLGVEQTWRLLLHIACRNASGEGVPAELLQAPCMKPPCKERQSRCSVAVRHPASLLAALANGALYVSKQITLSKV